LLVSRTQSIAPRSRVKISRRDGGRKTWIRKFTPRFRTVPFAGTSLRETDHAEKLVKCTVFLLRHIPEATSTYVNNWVRNAVSLGLAFASKFQVSLSKHKRRSAGCGKHLPRRLRRPVLCSISTPWSFWRRPKAVILICRLRDWDRVGVPQFLDTLHHTLDRGKYGFFQGQVVFLRLPFLPGAARF